MLELTMWMGVYNPSHLYLPYSQTACNVAGGEGGEGGHTTAHQLITSNQMAALDQCLGARIDASDNGLGWKRHRP